jgi:hypothetical protein
MATFYRVLYDRKHWPCWNSDPVANSSHHRPPCQWIDRWDKHDKTAVSVLETNYPLLCDECGKKVLFTARARSVFLNAPGKFTPEFIQNHWDSEEIYHVGELDGVCAFSSAQACLDWVISHSGLRDRAHEHGYVAFEGRFISEAPEDQGVVAHVITKLGSPMSLDELTSRFLPDQSGTHAA